MSITFNQQSVRAHHARTALKIEHSKFVYSLVSLILLAGGIGLTFLSFILAGPVLGIGLWLLMPVLWYRYELKDMPGQLSASGEDVALELALSAQILGRLEKIEQPLDLWVALDGAWQQRFFATRYGVGSDYFITALPTITSDTQQILMQAIQIARRHGHDELTAGPILVALLKAIPSSEEDLAILHLDLEELETSVDWLAHTENVIERIHEKANFGGVARDWTAGYTPTLNQLARNVSLEVEHGGQLHRDLDVHMKSVNEMMHFMAAGRHNVALVGELGTGRTTSVYLFAQQLLIDKNVPANLQYHQVFSLNASTLISQAHDGSTLENILIRVFNEAQKSKNAIIFLDEAHVFFSEGTGAVDLSKILTPVIEGGAVPIILAMSPTDWQELSVKNQSLTSTINLLRIEEPNEQETMQILEDETLLLESKFHVTFTYQALKEAYRLAGRYQHELAYPGRAIKVLEGAVNHAVSSLVTESSVQESLEATIGVKIKQVSAQEGSELLNLEEQIHTRMINQTRAVKVVSDALRRARSGVNNPNKPIGTFLFLGPTGVGKTELAKAVAATYFKDEEQMIRVDMNEFTQSSDSSRLLDQSSTSSLLSQISRQPFSVVLFDEIEKAHPQIVDIFLQLLDEGVMRDSANKQVSFRDAVIIATSNAGADKIRAYIDAGKEVSEFEDQFINEIIESNLFKPEFLNRFDEMVVFRPLKKEELLQLVDMLLAGVNKTLARQKVSIALDDASKQWLVDHGYDAKLGARPLRRMVQRTVENIVAKKILEPDFKPGSTVSLTVSDLEKESS